MIKNKKPLDELEQELDSSNTPIVSTDLIDEQKEDKKFDKMKKEMELIKQENDKLKTQWANAKRDSAGIEELKLRSTNILKKAKALDEQFANAVTAEDRKALIAGLDETLGTGDGTFTEYIQSAFPNIFSPAPLTSGAPKVTVTTDLPAGDILLNLPIRVIEQILARTNDIYKLVDLFGVETATLGSVQVFYSDYRDGDTKKGFDDVTINDFNAGVEPTTQETYIADQYFHKGYDILNTMLNQQTISIGLFVSLVNDYANAVIRPFAKNRYSYLVTKLDNIDTTTGLFDKMLEFPLTMQNEPIEKAKVVYREIISLNTTSRDHLTHIPEKFTTALQYSTDVSNLVLVLNKEYAANYNYDVVKGAFQVDAITLNFKRIIVIDFDKVNKFSSVATSSQVLRTIDGFIMEEGKGNVFTHYEGETLTPTPKLKSVLHRYAHYGFYERKDKILIGFRQLTA